ncbi:MULTISPECIES: hypothetical protein [Bradyrhizobium]|uniref:hypothetical protein n=1 Tax=Bradyrhizobium elkanii TaxID=29448 RepID=UPI0027152711|nr:hypothetical protein [Bradyrhizobium elkanii]WLA47127.1 hypothetical protein QIH80_36400 [Bradyrhizobium elkanii]WLB82588.1 hypothetical protein QIH83_08365 [Bradyrhizobium elkanii]
MADTLAGLAGQLETQVKALRGAGDDAALLAAARDAADQIERRRGAQDGDEREVLMMVQRWTFNAAADCWPGWSVSDKPINQDNLLAARELAERSLALVRSLGLAPLREGTGVWMVGAFDLALGRYDDASRLFRDAREQYVAASAPGLVLLVDGYAAIVRQVGKRAADGDDLDQACQRIAAGGFEDGDEWIAQLRTALEVFTRQNS